MSEPEFQKNDFFEEAENFRKKVWGRHPPEGEAVRDEQESKGVGVGEPAEPHLLLCAGAV